jgi:Zn-dependent protease
MGDSTAKSQGRLSLNPFRHLDPIGTLFLLLFGFGWASPVNINTSRYKNPRLGMTLTAAAGPFANLLSSFIGFFIYYIFLIYSSQNPDSYILSNLVLFFYYLAIYNATFGIFNLFPIPPLDGSKILAGFLPDRLRFKYLALERYSMYFFIILIITLNRLDILNWLVNLLFEFFNMIYMPILNNLFFK